MKRRIALLAALIVVAIAVLRPKTQTPAVAFDREVVELLNAHCVACHFSNGPSFPLETFAEVSARWSQLRTTVMAGTMPPWAAAPGDGQFAFVNENRLAPRDREMVASWNGSLAPGNAASAAARTDGWQLGVPDLIRTLPATTIEFEEAESARNVVIDLQLASERRIRTIEYRPGNRRLTRAVNFRVQETGEWIGSWTPWYGVATLPESAFHCLPRGAHIVAELYYGSSGDRVVDQGILGLYFADAQAAAVSTLRLEAKPASERQLFGETRLESSMDALALLPDIAAGLASIEVSARRPDGGTEILLSARNINAHWPTPYIFKSPVALEKGTVLSLTVDFSSDTPPPGIFRLAVTSLPSPAPRERVARRAG